jgi:hypothetical protein
MARWPLLKGKIFLVAFPCFRPSDTLDTLKRAFGEVCSSSLPTMGLQTAKSSTKKQFESRRQISLYSTR